MAAGRSSARLKSPVCSCGPQPDRRYLSRSTQCLHQFTQCNGIELVLGHESPPLRTLAGIRRQSGEVRTSDEGTYSLVTSLPLGEGTNTTRRLRSSPPLTEART